MRRRIVGVVLILLIGLWAGSVSLLAQVVVSGPAQMDQCAEGTFTITFTNPSSTQTACQIVFRNTAPSAEFSYVAGSGLAAIPGYGNVLADPALGSWSVDAIVGASYELSPGGAIAVQFRLSTTCLAVSGTDSARVDYLDCTQPGTPLQATGATSVEVLPGALTLEKAPANPAAGVGDLVTWTLTVNSTGLGSIKNVVATDTLGSGLQFVSATPAGQVVGQTITWSPLEIPALVDLNPDSSVVITLVARVVACTGLDNRLDGRFGCSGGPVCGNTVTDLGDCGSAPVSSVTFIERLPFLTFSAPTITIPYCAATTTVSIPITNSGDGTAHDGSLGANLGSSLVVSSVVGATYDVALAHFDLPDIPAPLPPALAYTHTLTFNVTYTGLWCSTSPSGTPLFTLDYKNDCGVTHLASPQYGSIGATTAPTLSVSKTGPSIAHFGSLVTYNITANYSGPTSCGPGPGTTSPITVTDYVPAGFTVTNAGDGTWTAGTGGTGGVIVWAFGPGVAFSKSVTLQIPASCGYCHTTQANTVTARATSCCGCDLTASSTVTTAITCEQLYTSSLTFSPSSALERCGTPVTFTDAHQFDNVDTLDGVPFSGFTYYVFKPNGLAYVPNSAWVTIDAESPQQLPSGSVIDGTDTVQFIVSDPRPVRNHTLTYTFQMMATSASQPACGGSSSYLVWEYHVLGSIGDCTERYDTEFLTFEAPAMSVGILGVPTIQEDCATYPVTITLHRTSTTAQPYDVRLVLTGTAGVIVNVADLASVKWSGVTPSEPAIIGSNTVEWRFADGFAASGASASLTVPVTTRCGGPLIGLAAQGFFDDRCKDDAVYNDTCSTSTSASSSLRLSGDIHITMTPEVVYTALRSVTWRIELYNASNGTAYSVYVDDVLGSGLAYASSSASGYSGALTTQANLNHTGGVINGASFLFERIAPGERPVITFTANLVACHGMTNLATVGWGCGGDVCQPTRSDSSYVLVAPANVVSTSFAPTPVDACTTEKATITLRSAGVATAYDLVATATLPTGLVYVGNPEVRIGAGGWLPTGTPTGIPGPTLTWNSTQVAALAAVASGVTIEIRFDVSASCSFSGGNLQVQTGYENPCGQSFTSAVGTFALVTRKPTLTLVTSQTSPAAGQSIPCGGDVTWEIRVTNSGPAVATAVWVEETLGAGLTYALSTGGADGGANSGQVTTWEILNLGVDATAVLSIKAHSTSGPGSCDVLTNSVKAYWACGPDGNSATTPDCLSSTVATASAMATRAATVTAAASMSPGSIGSCETQKTLTLTLSNSSTSVPAYNPDVRLTLPAGLSYRAGTTEVNCGSGFTPAANPQQAGQVLTWYNLTATGTGNDLCASIPASSSVAVRFQVDAACYRTTAPAPVDVYYYDCCGVTQYDATSSPSLSASAPTLSVTMTPSTATLDCANPSSTVTWTITVTNTGAATAGFVRILDTLGADLVRVSGGTQIGANPLQWGWEFGPLAAAGSQSVTMTARLAAPPNDCAVARRTSTAVTSWGCAASALDGDPNTTTEYSCTSSGGSVTRTATILVPDLSISASDISPQFTCASDGIANGRVLLTVRNTGTGAVTTDFSITFSESTTGWSGGGTFTSLGGTLPLAAGGSQVLTFSGWPIGCSSCSYQLSATIDSGGAICECRENDNTAATSYTPTCPALSVNKVVADVRRGGASLGVVDPVLYGDVIVYRVTVRNVGLGTAYDVDLVETLPTGLVVDTSSPYGAGTFAVGAPTA